MNAVECRSKFGPELSFVRVGIVRNTGLKIILWAKIVPMATCLRPWAAYSPFSSAYLAPQQLADQFFSPSHRINYSIFTLSTLWLLIKVKVAIILRNENSYVQRLQNVLTLLHVIVNKSATSNLDISSSNQWIEIISLHVFLHSAFLFQW